MILYSPLVVFIAGALVHGLSSGKASELGRISFGCGLLASLLTVSHWVHLP